MTRRPVLPGASELFRRTDTTAAEAEVTELPSVDRHGQLRPRCAARAPRSGRTAPLTLVPGGAAAAATTCRVPSGGRRTAAADAAARPHPGPSGPRAASGPARREDHRLHLGRGAPGPRGCAAGAARQHGLAVDRGRIVREAIAVVLADLEERGEDSVLVRRAAGALALPRLCVREQSRARYRRPPRPTVPPRAFTVRLTNFEGPFDLLLQLIGKHKLDVTEIALSKVTDEFIAHLRALGDGLDLDQASEFLVVASTLLDLKAARLLPAAEVDDEEDLELLEARDLLFARLLQYQRLQAGGGVPPRARGGGGPAVPARRRPGTAVRGPDARGVARTSARRSSPCWLPGADAEGARGRQRLPPARARGERVRAAAARAQPPGPRRER